MNEERGLVDIQPILYLKSDIDSLREADELIRVRFYLIKTTDRIKLNPIDNVCLFKWISKKDLLNKTLNVASGIEKFAGPKLISDGIIH